MKNTLSARFSMALICLLLCACSSSHDHSSDLVNVGMITDSGTIDDQSFNQGVWEGILKYQTDKGTIAASYLNPAGEQKSDYLTAITTLHESGHEIIVAPGFGFETAINEAAETFADTTFILIDGITHNDENPDFVAHANTLCLLFNEHEAGFLAGIAAALSTKTEQLGFVGGIEIPSVIRFGIGFRAGVKYANQIYGSNAELRDDNYVYQGSFSDSDAGTSLADVMYADGVDIIFSVAGLVGVGVIDAAKERVALGEEVWVIGVDSDQYNVGLLANGSSVILTSALKRVDIATYRYIDSALQGTFPGGEVITLTLADNALGLPDTNPNLAAEVELQCRSAAHEVAAGTVVVPATAAQLLTFLEP